MTAVAPYSEDPGERKPEDAGEDGVVEPLKPWQRIVMRIPIVNLVYELFFDQPPSFEQMEKFIATVSLVDALMLAVVMALPMSFDYDAYLEMDERMASGYASGYFRSGKVNSADIVDSRLAFSQIMLYDSLWATNCLGGSLVISVICYLMSTSTDMNTAWILNVMWPSVRWLMLLQFTLTFVGVISSFNMYSTVASAIFPNYGILTETDQPWVLQQWRDNGETTFWGYVENWQYIVSSMRTCFITSTLLSCAVFSYAVWRKAVEMDRRAANAKPSPLSSQ